MSSSQGNPGLFQPSMPTNGLATAQRLNVEEWCNEAIRPDELHPRRYQDPPKERRFQRGLWVTRF